MEKEIIERLKSIKNREAILLFFKFLKTFLAELKISPENPKVSLNIRNDYRQRISVNLNGRLVLGLAQIRKKIEIQFMVNQDDLPEIEQSYSIGAKDKFKDDQPQAFLVGIDCNEILIKDQHEILSPWIKSCKEYEPKQERSQYRSHNIPQLFDMANDEKLLSSIIDKSLKPEKIMNYYEYQKKVFDWLMTKHNADENFCFSTRLKSNKGAEKNYFIGTERSNYFGTTFWLMPISYPGSSGDLIDLMFTEKPNGYTAYLQFMQTKDPHDKQNKLALQFIQELKPKLKKSFPRLEENNPENKIEYFAMTVDNKVFSKVDDLLAACESFLSEALQIVDTFLADFKTEHEGFDANRIDKETFQTKYLKKLQVRLKRVEAREKIEEDQPEEIENGDDQDYPNLPLNLILCGPPGTGKTYNTINKALEIADPTFYSQNKDNRELLVTKFQELRYNPELETGQIAFITFHQAMTYEDFIEGIKPIMDNAQTTDQVQYDIIPGIFKAICNSAQTKVNNFNEKIEWLKSECSEADGKKPVEIDSGKSKFKISFKNGTTFKVKPEKSTKPDAEYPASIENIKKIYEGASRREVYNPTYTLGILEYLYKNGLEKYEEIREGKQANYVLIIDEINRGNIANIFGELITLIEKDKRLGNPESLKTILPYTKEEFGVPKNFYIIGTMNTADRSVEALDTALRRRFSFIEMTPRYDLEAMQTEIIEGISLSNLLQGINQRIEKLLDKDHMIGHSYFLGVMDIQGLLQVFKDNIIPLLQEYFYGDFGKIGLVLGGGFIHQVTLQGKEKIFADFKEYDEDISDLEERKVYRIVDLDNMSDYQFTEALLELLKTTDGKDQQA